MAPLPGKQILTTTVGSYPLPAWLLGSPSEEAVVDATRVVFDTQRQAGIDLPTDGELYRFDPGHPDTNGMIEYFVGSMAGTRTEFGRSEIEEFSERQSMGFREKPAAVVDGELGEGSLDLLGDCARAAAVSGGPFKFTVTSPYMLARQVAGLSCSCLQIDEANIPGNPDDGPLAARAINRVLEGVDEGVEKAVHFCFGNYGGQVIQDGTWSSLVGFLNDLQADHLVLELAHRPDDDLAALREIDPRLNIGIGVIDIKVNQVETAEEVAARIEKAAGVLGGDRIRFVHPDCGFWMLKRSVSDRKIAALAKGRDLYLGI